VFFVVAVRATINTVVSGLLLSFLHCLLMHDPTASQEIDEYIAGLQDLAQGAAFAQLPAWLARMEKIATVAAAAEHPSGHR
jgi:hypothetical protein